MDEKLIRVSSVGKFIEQLVSTKKNSNSSISNKILCEKKREIHIRCRFFFSTFKIYEVDFFIEKYKRICLKNEKENKNNMRTCTKILISKRILFSISKLLACHIYLIILYL